MSWTSLYRATLHLLPTGLRRKHGRAMETLFARNLERARERGRVHGALAGAMGVWDVIHRGVVELLRPEHVAEGERGDTQLSERWNMDANAMQPTTRQLLRRHAVSFVIAFLALTVSLLAIFAAKQVPALIARGMPTRGIIEVLLLAVPFTAALTIPMAVLVAVLREFTRLRTDGTLVAARRERDGVRRLVLPLLGAAAGVAALALVVTAEIVPRANLRLAQVIAGSSAPRSDRTMTIGELREASRTVRPDTDDVARGAAARYEVEIQKKLALAAACMIMAVAGVAITLRVPRGGAALVIGASCVVFFAYYMLMVTGESLANRLVVSPFVGMWGANALVLVVALLAVLWRRGPFTSNGTGAVAIRGLSS